MQTFMRKIPLGAEASNILIGEQGDLKKPIIAFIRLKEAMTFGKKINDLSEIKHCNVS